MSSETYKLKFKDQTVWFSQGKTLFEIIKENQLDVFWGNSAQFTCNGNGQCALCLVRVFGKGGVLTEIEAKRLKKTSLKSTKHLRLACQCLPEGDVSIEKPIMI